MSGYEYDDEEPYVIIERHSGSVGSLLLGVAIGAGVALLFAPQSGPETRQRIRSEADRARRRAARLADDVSATVQETISDARSQVEERVDAARQAVEVRRQQVARAVEAGRAAAHEARAELERRIQDGKAAYDAGVAAARTRTPATAGTTGDGGTSGIIVPGTAEAGVLGAADQPVEPAAARRGASGGRGRSGGRGTAGEGSSGGAVGA